MELEKNNQPIEKNLADQLLTKSQAMEGGMGAISFAVLEMFRRGGMDEADVKALHEKMKVHFMKPSNAECNAVLKMVETRLQMDKEPGQNAWYY